MIDHIDISGVRYHLDENTTKYIHKKLGRLDRFLPRHARKTAQLEVVLKEVNRAHGNKYECDVLLKLPGKNINAKDSTMNMLAAVDIVEAKLATQLKKYKEMTKPYEGNRGVFARLKHRATRVLPSN